MFGNVKSISYLVVSSMVVVINSTVMDNNTNNLKEIYESMPELAWQLILANHDCKCRVLVSIGYDCSDVTKPPVATVETLLKMEATERMERTLKGLKMYQQANSSRMHKTFILDLESEDFYADLEAAKYSDPKQLAKTLLEIEPNFIRL